MIDFIITNMATIGTALIAIVLIVWAIITRQWSILRTASLSLMVSAEKLMATSAGSKKMEAVLAAAWEKLPAWIKKFYDKNKLRNKLQKWFDLAKDALGETKTE